jgi:hypothetical protein
MPVVLGHARVHTHCRLQQHSTATTMKKAEHDEEETARMLLLLLLLLPKASGAASGTAWHGSTHTNSAMAYYLS